MATATKITSLFRILAMATAVLLAITALVVYLQRGTGSADDAVGDASRQLAAARADADALDAAAATVAERAVELLSLTPELLDATGGAVPVQEFEARLQAVLLSATSIRSADDPATVAADIGENVEAIAGITAALGGGDSDVDLAPLTGDAADGLAATVAAAVADMQAAAPAMESGAAALAGYRAAQRRLAAAAGSASTPGPFASVWIPIGLLIVALLLVAVLFGVNRKLGSFERIAGVQAAQNERNQQAILRLLDEMGSLADGDLTVEATVTEDITGTIADSFNYAIEELRKLVATVNETAIMVDSAAKQTESTASHMARAAETQSREISAATESIVSMAASIEEVSGNAERSSDVARHSVDVAHKGGEAVRRTIDGMNTIRETIQDTSKRIKRLGESSQEIGNIVELINDIAEQTNILALNASIQASMAGEAGRGFAVVADEVQRLAERSTSATRQIEVLVSTIQADTKEAVVSMERSTTDVVGGALLAENAGAALDEIEQVSNQIASLVQNISSSAREQAGAAADVTRRTTRLREISEQTGKATTATAAAISKLAEFASALRRSVAGFTLPGGKPSGSAPQQAGGAVPPAQDRQAGTG